MAIPIKTGEKGPQGIARVNVSEKKVTVIFEDGDKFDLTPADCPKYLVKSGKYAVSLNLEGTTMYNARPLGGSHLVRFKEFTHKKDEPPAPKIVSGGLRTKKDGTRFVVDDSVQFGAIFQIVGPDHTGFELAYFVPYAFKNWSDETGIGGKGSQKLEAFLRSTGIDFSSDTIPFSDNVLPWLQKFLRTKNTLLIATLTKEGYIDTLASAPSGIPAGQIKE